MSPFTSFSFLSSSFLPDLQQDVSHSPSHLLTQPAPALFPGGGGGGGAVAQSVEHATPGQEVPGSIPAVAARSLLVGSVSV